MSVDTPELSPPAFLRLVADAQRWRLLSELARSDRRVGELSELLNRPQNLVSYHLGELRAAGLVSGRRSSADGRDTYYRLDVARCGELLTAAGAALHPGIRLGRSTVEVPTGHGGRPWRVLFLCTGNSARSQIAEALLVHRSGRAIDARSAGSDPRPVHPNAVRVMAERGIDISGCAAKHVDRFARSRFDRVITLCDKVKEVCPDLPGPPATAHWSMADPAAAADTDDASYAAFLRTADEVELRVALLIAEMTNPSQERSAHDRR